MMPEASLRSHFIKALKKDPIAQKLHDNPPPELWSWQDSLLLHDNLVYVPQNDTLHLALRRGGIVTAHACLP